MHHRMTHIGQLEAHIANLEGQLRQKDEKLNAIYTSRGWKLLSLYYRTRDRLLPADSSRRKVIKSLWKFITGNGKPSVRPVSDERESAPVEAHDTEAYAGIKDTLIAHASLKLKVFFSDCEGRMRFPHYDTPRISIILVTYDKAWHTFRCLESVKAHADIPYEVVLVDNGSKDETLKLLERLDNVKRVFNATNRGFTLACNQGSGVAAGDYFLFLNNDTEILPACLSTLLATIENDSVCGAVGARLILPDGRLQEAGSIIWRDGSALGYGRNDDPFLPEYSYVREVDYCSGACLLVRADLFKELGGFDERFAPAYYEETDFCMSLRQKGYKVVYQPSASVIHYEFGSSTLDKAVELQQTNRAKFFEKWDTILGTAHEPMLLENVLRARDRNEQKRILVIDDRIPVPYLGSGYPRMYKILRFLAELGHRLSFFPLQNPGIVQPYTKHFQQLGIEVFFNDGTKKLDLKGLLNTRPHYYDIIIVSRPHNAKESLDVIKITCPDAVVIYDAEALFSQREIIQRRLIGETLSPADEKELVQEEITLMERADVIVTVSQAERNKIISHGIGNVVIWGHPMTPKPTLRSFSEREGILFVGSFLNASAPNEDAMLYFVREVFPLLKERLETQLFIVGTNYMESIKNLASSSVVVTGRVDNIEDYYDRCRIFIVPTRYAAGIPWKLQEAMSYGLPAVVSPLIAEQLALSHGHDVLVAGSSTDFAEQVISLYEDESLWKTIRNGGLKHIEAVCNPQKLKQDMSETLIRFAEKN